MSTSASSVPEQYSPVQEPPPLPVLQPRLPAWLVEMLANPSEVLSEMEGSSAPLNILTSTPFRKTIGSLLETAELYRLPLKIYFARKANRAPVFVEASIAEGIGIDTASMRELEEVLDAGLPPARAVLTSAVKPSVLLEYAAGHGVLTVLDNVDEIEAAGAIAERSNEPFPVALRMSGFRGDSGKLYSRFGFDIAAAGELRALLRDSRSKSLQVRGLHFHLAGYSIPDRANAIAALVDLADDLRSDGHPISFIDAGGGLMVNYLQHRSEWESFEAALKDAVLGKRAPITFNNDGLGFREQGGELFGAREYYPFFNTVPKEQFLAAVLSTTVRDGQNVAELLRGHNLSLSIEPGRCLLDQCGATFAEVAFRKRDSRGDLLIGLMMNRSQCRSSSADFCLDPLLLPRDNGKRKPGTGAYLMGQYCIESDLILKRKIALAFTPEVGDVVCFPNTAAYMMQLFQSDAHGWGMARELVLENGRLAGRSLESVK